ncbi:EAL domain-containing protein [Paenibacillus rhizovicinus]|uniref:EAL domain-containing protein n=1 Tax=Paenibacillus rhizovicinus TaxID=2704463 RepID=A0A6C0P4R3_9BACL|nr:EAL domain-containing protein [Paenibacillus rhizovicinus]QHW33321.1 EAL domain-containing protein [Paenibacillus rhizovicinus]
MEPAQDIVIGIEDIESAIADNRFVIYYQPQISVNDHKIYGAEALTRLIHPVHGLLAPHYFIETSEQDARVAANLFYYICKDAAGWLQEPQLSDWRFSINVSLRTMLGETFKERLAAIFDRGAANRITLELTESEELCSSYSDLRRLFAELQRSGFRIAFDDFGKGQRHLFDVLHLPVDIVKLDRAFVTALSAHAQLSGLFRPLLQEFHSRGILTVIEGIELQEQYRAWRALGIDAVQGYIVGKPMPMELLIDRTTGIESHRY